MQLRDDGRDGQKKRAKNYDAKMTKNKKKK